MKDEKQQPEWHQRLEQALSSVDRVKEAETKSKELTEVSFSVANAGSEIAKPIINEADETRQLRTKYISETLGNFHGIFESLNKLGNKELAQSLSAEAQRLLKSKELGGSPQDVADALDAYGEVIDTANHATPNKIRDTMQRLGDGNRFGDLQNAVDAVLEKSIEWTISNADTQNPEIGVLGDNVSELINRKLCLAEIGKRTEKMISQVAERYIVDDEARNRGYFTGTKTPLPVGF